MHPAAAAQPGLTHRGVEPGPPLGGRQVDPDPLATTGTAGDAVGGPVRGQHATARNTPGAIELSSQLQERGVDLVVLDQGIDTSTAAGRMFLQILGAIAEFEHALMSERTLDGLAAARGRTGGQKPKLTPRRHPSLTTTSCSPRQAPLTTGEIPVTSSREMSTDIAARDLTGHAGIAQGERVVRWTLIWRSRLAASASATG